MSTVSEIVVALILVAAIAALSYWFGRHKVEAALIDTHKDAIKQAQNTIAVDEKKQAEIAYQIGVHKTALFQIWQGQGLTSREIAKEFQDLGF